MQRLEVSVAVRLIHKSLGVKGLNVSNPALYQRCVLFPSQVGNRQSRHFLNSLNLRQKGAIRLQYAAEVLSTFIPIIIH